MSAPSQALKPVKGSVRLVVVGSDVVVAVGVAAVAAVVLAVALAAVGTLEPELTVPVEPDEALDDEDPEL